MAICKFHSCTAGKRRGETLPARLRFIARRGVTLVELMIAMLILTIVCLSWLEIIGIQSARKEARRREAVERLAGMMDAFMYCKKSSSEPKKLQGGWYLEREGVAYSPKSVKKKDDPVRPVFDDAEAISPIGYRLDVVPYDDPLVNVVGSSYPVGSQLSGWGKNLWLVGRLYNHCGTDVGLPFFTLRICLWL